MLALGLLPMNTYQQTVDFLYSRLPMFSRVGSSAIRKDLTNTLELTAALGNPHNRFKTIHVGGTNGKGSVSHMLASVLQSAGYKTALYTSPHLRDFRERIRINGEPIDPDFVVNSVKRMRPLIEKISPSFFEVTVALAFDYFATSDADVAVVEVGLGGRLDSTNIVRPVLSVITNVGWDHMNLLGDTLPKIAAEKGGIIKENVPVVIGEANAETKHIFEMIAKQKNAVLYFAESTRYVTDWKYSHHELVVEVADKKHDEREKYRLDLTGFYQTKNLITTLESLRILNQNGWKISPGSIDQGLRHVKRLTGLHGRWDVIRQQPVVALDVGHNTDGVRQIVAQIELTEYDQLHLVIGFVKDKEIEKMLSLLPKEATYYFTRAQIPRAIDENELARIGNEMKLRGKPYPHVHAALDEAMANAKSNDLIVVCGSVFVVGEVETDRLKN